MEDIKNTETIKLPKLHEDDFRAREAAEGDPNNYTTRTKETIDETDEAEIIKRLRELQSGFIDLRNLLDGDSDSKFTIWLGEDHATIARNEAKFPDDINLSDYLVGIRVIYNSSSKRMEIERDLVGQSCNRTKEQIEKIIDAAEKAINVDLISKNKNFSKILYFKSYGVNPDSISENDFIEDLDGEIKDENKKYKRILLSRLSGDFSPEDLKNKIEETVSHLRDDRSTIILTFNFKKGEVDNPKTQLQKLRMLADKLETDHRDISAVVEEDQVIIRGEFSEDVTGRIYISKEI